MRKTGLSAELCIARAIAVSACDSACCVWHLAQLARPTYSTPGISRLGRNCGQLLAFCGLDCAKIEQPKRKMHTATHTLQRHRKNERGSRREPSTKATFSGKVCKGTRPTPTLSRQVTLADSALQRQLRRGQCGLAQKTTNLHPLKQFIEYFRIDTANSSALSFPPG